MQKRLLFVFLALIIASCQLFTSQAVKQTTPSTDTTQMVNTVEPEPTDTLTPISTTAPALASNGPLADIRPNITQPFGLTEHPIYWNQQPYQQSLDTLPADLTQVANPGVIAGLTEAQRQRLSESGFVVINTGEDQFSDIRKSVGEQQGQPYYLTTDAAYHALHITFSEMLKNLEREFYHAQVLRITNQLLDQVLAYPTHGTEIEDDARLAAAYLAVALRLLDPQAQLPQDLEAEIAPQMGQIRAGSGRAPSALIPSFEDDYGAYKPVGHYSGDAQLERYFQAMTWLGRVELKLNDPENPQFRPSRAPLIITLALRETQAGADWKSLNEILHYVIGPSDDPGPAELAQLMDQVYGPDSTIHSLEDNARWEQFLQQVDSLPAPQINSTFVESTAALQASRGWRLLGQRLTFDAVVFQNLIYDQVGTPEKPRKLPSGLDVMAVFGSPAAQDALETAGETDYANYTEQLQTLQSAAQAQPEAQWMSNFYSGWLFSFFPQLEAKDAAYPPYMRSALWQQKEMTSALGSWTALKHDTVLYNKMPEFMAGGGPPGSGPAPAWVEPNPAVFYRLGSITSSLAEGLSMRLPEGLTHNDVNHLYALERLGMQYQALGEIAAKELAGALLSNDDYHRIGQCLGLAECQPEAFEVIPPIPLAAAVSGAEDVILTAATGKLDRIYVIVPLEGRPQVAQGGVYSYYEFTRLRDQRLSDDEWRNMLASQAPARPGWYQDYLLPGGEIRAATAFRVGDVYLITQAGGNPPLNVRAEASRSGRVLGRLVQATYITIIDGPVTNGSDRWWKVREEWGEAVEGWVLEHPDWYERAYGQ
jgi:hypothetical protein